LFAQEKHFLPNGNYYCVACLQFGRLTNEDVLLSKEDSDYQQRKVCFGWQGTFTPPQQEIADSLLKNNKKKQHSLVWAVTGSGKTEMIFPIIQQVLSIGGRLLRHVLMCVVNYFPVSNKHFQKKMRYYCMEIQKKSIVIIN
jgi:competence protein ComFA